MLAVQVNYLRHLEEKRHNLATEQLGVETLQETQRSNRVREDQGFQQIAVQQGSLIENQRHNQEMERIQSVQASAAQTNAQASMLNAQSSAALRSAQSENLQAQTAATNVDTLFNMATLGSRAMQINLSNLKSKADTELSQARTTETTIKAGAAAVNTISNLIDSIIPF